MRKVRFFMMVMHILLGIGFFGLKVQAKTYYVATTGNDANPGTIELPWGTWQKAFITANAGDTVFLRGGIWYPKSHVSGYAITRIDPANNFGHNGTYKDPICFFNYPGETPILDCINASLSSTGNVGINVDNATYLKFKGLTVRNARMLNSIHNVVGVGFSNCGVISCEQMTVYNTGGAGMWFRGYDSIFVKNCDVYNSCDSLDAASPGGDGDGFCASSRGLGSDTLKYTYFEGCRSWNNSDDGFDIGTTKQLLIKNCWSWANGKLKGDGSGFKFAYGALQDQKKRNVFNCITAYNHKAEDESGAGTIITNLLDTVYGPRMNYFNNTSYKDYVGHSSSYYEQFDCATDYALDVYKNNLVYAPTNTNHTQAFFGACNYRQPTYVEMNQNTWLIGTYANCYINPDFDVTDDDFISLDTAQLRWPRTVDGSLPDISFMKPKKGSDLIDAGVYVGLKYEGRNPDIGAIEYGGIIVKGEGGSNQINVDNGTLNLTATILSDYDSTKGITWTIINGNGQATISPDGQITAIANGTVTARAILNDGSEITGSLVIIITNQLKPVEAINVMGEGGVTSITQANNTLQLYANVLPENASNKTIQWSVESGSGRASISKTGLVTPILNGSVTANAAATDGSGVIGTMQIQISSIESNESDLSKVMIYADKTLLRITLINNAEYTQASIINLYGQVITTEKINSPIFSMDISFVPSAVYLLKLSDEYGNYSTLKFSKP